VNNRLKNKQYRRSLKGQLVRKYQSMRKRSLDPNRPNIPNEHLCSRQEFYDFALNSIDYRTLHANWVESGFEFALIPTVDRIDNTKGYLIDNIQFITHTENVCKGNDETRMSRRFNGGNHKKPVRLEQDNKVLLFPSGKATCDFLGLGYAAVANAIHEERKVQGWTPYYM